MKILHQELLPEPNFQGKGVHSVYQLEQYKEFVHQMRVKQQKISFLTKSEIV